MRRIEQRGDRTLALQVPQRPKHARAAEVKAFETASRLIAFIVERMQGPMTFGKAIPLNVVHDGLYGLARTRRIPGSVAKRFMAIRLEEHGMAVRMGPWLLGRRAHCSEQMVNSDRQGRFVAYWATTGLGRLPLLTALGDMTGIAASRLFRHAGPGKDGKGKDFYLPFSPSRQAMTSSSPRTASSTGITGCTWKTNAGSIEQNL